MATKNPEKSQDFSFENPGILADCKSRDPGIPGIPLGPGGQALAVEEVTIVANLNQGDHVHLCKRYNVYHTNKKVDKNRAKDGIRYTSAKDRNQIFSKQR